MKQQKVSDYCIKKALEEIDEDAYLKTIGLLAERKLESLKTERNRFTKMAKLKNYLLQKGYEFDYIHDILTSNF